MTRFTLLFALSLALNVGMATLLILHIASTPEVRQPGEPFTEVNTFANDQLSDSAGATTSAAIRSYRRLHSILSATNLPPPEIHRLMRGAALSDWSDDAIRLYQDVVDEENLWREKHHLFEESNAHAIDFQRRVIELRRAREAALAVVIGESFSIDPRHSLFGQTHLPHLTAEERRKVIMLEEDYRLLMIDVQAQPKTGPYPELPDTLEAMRMLKEERLQDLAAILSPEELEEYELQTSDVARRLRTELKYFDADEEEFRTIFRVRHGVETRFPSNSWALDPEHRKEQMEAEEATERRLREVLGDERFAAYQRAQSAEYQQLVELVAQLDLSRDRADAIYDIRNLVEEHQLLIQLDEDLTGAERDFAMKRLAEEAIEMVQESLGSHGYDAYTALNGWWIRSLEDKLKLTEPGSEERDPR